MLMWDICQNVNPFRPDSFVFSLKSCSPDHATTPALLSIVQMLTRLPYNLQKKSIITLLPYQNIHKILFFTSKPN